MSLIYEDDLGDLKLMADASGIDLAWPDGRKHRFEAAWLRAHCPCSKCRHASFELEPGMFPGLNIVSVSPVGRYAIQPVFSDQHNGGAYSFDLLEKLSGET